MTEFTEEKSRTQIKKEAVELQKLGERLILLTKAQLLSINIPPELVDAILMSKTITTNKAIRRQKQYIGALMREIDTEPVLKALQHIEDGVSLTNIPRNILKDWHKKLIEGDDSLIETIIEEHPETERQKLRQLIRNARKEHLSGKSQKASKNLQNYLKEVIGYS